MTNEALQGCEHVHQAVATRPKRTRFVFGARNRVYPFRSCCTVENPAASFPGGDTTYNTNQSAVRKFSRSAFGDDLDADGRLLGQFGGARRNSVPAENERHQVCVLTGAEGAPSAVRHVSAHII